MTERKHTLQPAMVHQRRRRIRWLVIGAILLVPAAIAGAALYFASRHTMTECERAYRKDEYQHAIDLCGPSYERTKDASELVWAAESYVALGKYEEAGALAQRLIGGPRYGAGHKILSNVLLRVSPAKPQEAKFHATAAVQEFARTKDLSGQVGASRALSQASWALGEFGVALAAADDVVRLATQLGDRRGEVAGHLLRADALQNMGDQIEATKALLRAAERAEHPCDKAWSHYRTGLQEMNGGLDSLARQEFMKAEQENLICGHAAMKIPLALSLAWLEREKAPRKAIERLDMIKAAGEEGFESLLLRAYLAADRGALDEVETYLAEAEAAEPPDADWAWNLEVGKAELAELRGGLFGDSFAEYHYRRAIAMVSELRSETPTASAFLVATHRGPFDGLISLYARNGRWRDALAVVLELDASDMLRSTAATSKSAAPSALAEASAPRYPRRSTPAVDDILRAWAESRRDLAISIAPAEREIGRGRGLERAYRMHVVGGEVRGEEVGDANVARKWAIELFEQPENVAAGQALGRLMVPPVASLAALDVLAIGVLGKAPLAALRSEDGAPIITRRPLARVVALHAERLRATGTDAPVIIADSKGDLRSAEVEGRLVARMVGDGARTFGLNPMQPATRESFRNARHASLLHVAGHADEHDGKRHLMLSDGTITPEEIVSERIAPQLAVLASCGSFAANDEEGWGSLAMALLEAGTSTVIATDRTVPDDASLELIRGFYRQPDWRTAPNAALARTQIELAGKLPAGVLAAYTVIQGPPDLHAPTLR